MSNARSSRHSAPKYTLHKPSGQARVRIQGQDHYLGRFGTEASREAYARLLTEKWSPSGKPKARVRRPDDEISITYLAVEYIKHAQAYYQKNGKPTSEFVVAKNVIKRLRASYGSLPVADFGPVRYKHFRQGYIDEGLARTTINHYMLHIKLMMELAVSHEVIPVEYYQRLKCVGNLKQGRSEAKEPKKIRPVDDDLVAATLKKLTPLLRDMVVLQRLAGMRPGELTQIRPIDIDRQGEIWFYRPASHKTEHRELDRVIVFGSKAQSILEPYLLRDPQAFCFTPAEAYKQHYERRNKQRTTPNGYGNQATGMTKMSFQPCYDKNSYRRAIQRAALRAFPVPEEIADQAPKVKAWKEKYCWSPNQLRHAAATEARAESGLETAQQILGHASKKTTEKYYAEIDLNRAIEFARKFG